MRPSRAYLIVRRYWAVAWLAVWTIGGGVVGAASCKPIPGAWMQWPYPLLIAIVVLLSLPIGFFVGGIVGSMILGTIHNWILAVKGPPFRPGDIVRVHFGPHRGCVARVYEVWESGYVRLELDDQAKCNVTDVFHWIDVWLEHDEPTSATQNPRA